jgi:hypothetical protein
MVMVTKRAAATYVVNTDNCYGEEGGRHSMVATMAIGTGTA